MGHNMSKIRFIKFRLSDHMYADLDAIAEKELIPTAAVVRQACSGFIAAYKRVTRRKKESPKKAA